MKRRTTLRAAPGDPNLLGKALGGDSWGKWRVLLLAAMGERLRDGEVDVFRALTQRSQPPGERVQELWAVVGRRGGKSRAIATLLAYLGCLCDHRGKLASGEQGIALCLAPSQQQASIVLDYCAGIINESPILRQFVVRQTAEQIELNNRVTIEVRAASFRRLRGPTLIAAVMDEIAFFHSDESANPDIEILNALRPALGTTNGLLACISSPYAKRGELWQTFTNHYGDKGDAGILVAKGTTRDLNPSYEQSKIDREYERDPQHAAAEYGGQFRTDLEIFVDVAVITNCVDAAVHERPHDPRLSYAAFTDPSGGSSDSFTLAIGHREGKLCVLDVVREVKPPFSPEATVAQFCKLLRSYRINSVVGDKYAGEWPREQFRKWGISYEPSEKTKSEIYLDALPILNSHLAALLDLPMLTRQLTALERKTSRGGRDSIDHPPGAKDDIANAVAGVLVNVAEDNVGVSNPRWNMPMQDLMRHLPNPESPARREPGAMNPSKWPRGSLEDLIAGD